MLEPGDLLEVDLAELRAFLSARRAEGLGNASAARELSAVRGFLSFAAGAYTPLTLPAIGGGPYPVR